MDERHRVSLRVSLRGGRAEEANSACGDLRRNLGRAGPGFDQAGAESLASCLDLQPSAESTRSARTMQPGRAASLGNRKQLFGGEVSGLSVRALLFAGLEGHEGLPLPDSAGTSAEHFGAKQCTYCSHMHQLREMC